MIKIVVDLLGADKPQTELVSGAIRAISENKDLYVSDGKEGRAGGFPCQCNL